MTSTLAPQRPEPTRTGAVWVTGTGAFLLLAAAAVFTAVRWDQIHQDVKLAALGLATGAFLVAGRRLAGQLPATASALFHLGTLLVPIDVAALGVNAELTWGQLLLAEGIAATLTFEWAATVERSVVLRWAAGAGVVLLAGGIGATTAVPAAVALAGAALGAVAWRAHGPAVAWAAVVGLSPLATLVQADLTTGAGTLHRLGLAPGELPATSALAAVAASVVLGIVAQRLAKVDLAFLAVVVGITGVATSWAGTEASSGSTAVALAAGFVGVQLAALALRRDAFWSDPARVVSSLGEVGAAVGVVALALTALSALASGDGRPAPALAGALLAVGWVVADRRRGEAGLLLASTTIGLSAAATVALVTTEPVALSLTLVAVALAAVAAGRHDGLPVAVVAATAAPVVAWSEPIVAILAGVVGAVTIGECAVRRSRQANEATSFRGSSDDVAGSLSLLALAPLGLAAYGAAHELASTSAALVAVAVATTALAAWIDRGEPLAGDLPLGTLVRACTTAVLAGTAGLSTGEVAVVAATAAGLSMLDAVRLRHPQLAFGAALSAPVAIGAFVRSTGVSLPATGVALTVAAVVVAGIGSLTDRRWRAPCLATVGVLVVGGLALAQAEPAALSHALMVTGALGLAGGLLLDRVDLQLAAGAVAVVGFWVRLDASGVGASEPYLLPVTALLLVAGSRALAKGTASSWVAFGPAIALLGGSALAERVGGGDDGHALVAGAVGVVAVIAGGQRRLAAPLLIGTALLVALVGYESLAITTGLSTWVWLATGGAVLLGAGVAMERHEVGPIETGRRLVDVVHERYR